MTRPGEAEGVELGLTGETRRYAAGHEQAPGELPRLRAVRDGGDLLCRVTIAGTSSALRARARRAAERGALDAYGARREGSWTAVFQLEPAAE